MIECTQNIATCKMRDPLIDILKGIGIVSVVIGHSGVLFPGGRFIPSVQFVYMYHLMLFFFTAGAVFSPEKHADPYVYIGRQLKGSLPLYWGYNFFFLLLHNLLANAELLNLPVFSLNDYIVKGSGTFTLTYVEQLGGALWFVPMLLMAKLLFSVAFQIARKCKFPIIAHIVIICFFTALGLYTNYWEMFFTHHIQTAFLGIPIIYLGYIFRLYRHRIIKYLNAFTCLLSAAAMWLLSLNLSPIELSVNAIVSPSLFYPLTILGLLFAVSLGSLILRSKIMTSWFSYCGVISFHIMALHFLAFKLFDWIYGLLRGMDHAELMRFPTMLKNMGLLYSVIGIALPVLVVRLFQKCTTKAKQSLR